MSLQRSNNRIQTIGFVIFAVLATLAVMVGMLASDYINVIHTIWLIVAAMLLFIITLFWDALGKVVANQRL